MDNGWSRPDKSAHSDTAWNSALDAELMRPDMSSSAMELMRGDPLHFDSLSHLSEDRLADASIPGHGTIESSAVQAAYQNQATQAVLLGGDFYRDPKDDVMRGMSMGVSAISSGYASSQWMGADFLPASEEKRSSEFAEELGESIWRTSRGEFLADLCHKPDIAGQHYGAEFFDPSFLDEPTAAHGSQSSAPTKKAQNISSELRFQATDVAPSEPDEGLEGNNVVIAKSTAFDVGNRLLEFFQNCLDAQVVKVNRRKCSMKVEAFTGASCFFKIRLFRQGKDDIAIEFERKKGDSIAFNKVFRQTRHFLCQESSSREAAARIEPSSHEESPPVYPPPICSPSIDSHFSSDVGEFVQNSEAKDDIMAPLINIVEGTDDSTLHGEVAASLADIAQDPKMVRHLCRPEASLTLQKLLQSNDFRISCPMAKMLTLVARHPQSDVFFLQQGRLKDMVATVQMLAPASKALLEPLTRALGRMLDCCADKLPSEAAQELAIALAEALKGSNPQDRANATICDSLRAPYQKVLAAL